MFIMGILVITTISALDAGRSVRIHVRKGTAPTLFDGRLLDFLGDFLFVLGLGFAVLVVVFDLIGSDWLLAVIGHIPSLAFELHRRGGEDQLYFGLALGAFADMRVGKLLNALEAMVALLALVFVKGQKTPSSERVNRRFGLILRLPL
jgi:hypothetical protein